MALTLAGSCGEKIAALRRIPRRWFWAATMVLSIAWPLAMMLSVRPAAVITAQAPESLALDRVIARAPPGAEIPRATAAAARVEPAAVVRASGRWHLPLPSDRTLLIAWALATVGLLACLSGTALYQRRQGRRWQQMTVLDQEVLVSDATGPALLGVLRPKIVAPRWFLDEPKPLQSLVLEYERHHIAARDPLLMRAGLLIVVAVPWNLPLWWQLRRLRQAIELDCDARVVGAGAPADAYGEVLLAVTQRAAAMPFGVLAMSEPVSALERRIRSLAAGAPRRALPVMIGAIAVAVAGAAVATSLDAPALMGNPAHGAPAPKVARSDALPRLLPPQSVLPSDRAAAPPEDVVRALVTRYPELVTGADSADPYEATVVLRSDGSIYRSELRNLRSQTSANEVSALANLLAQGAGTLRTAMLRGGVPSVDGTTLRVTVLLRYSILPDGYDETRTPELVQAAILTQHPELLLPVNGDRVNRVTVYMTEDGKVDRFYNELRLREQLRPAGDVVPEEYGKLWEPLGLVPEQLGVMGLTYAYSQGSPQMVKEADGTAHVVDERKYVIVRYAWPRRPGEPMGGAQSVALHPGTPGSIQFSQADAATVVEHYFPGALNSTGVAPAGIPWLLLSRQGIVVNSGYWPAGGNPAPSQQQFPAVPSVKTAIETASPGMKIGEFMPMSVVRRYGESFLNQVIFVWLAPDAPSAQSAR
ncbi:MAG TPA: M56 family metallopeptidase [Steroidobacteraceae bacterium]|nr:M56 family metallopeptidase [Steroidobacteraceae bacterium]